MSYSSQVKPSRSPVISVEVVSNKKGWYINYASNGVPANSYGPFDKPVTIVEALTFVATQIAIDQ